MTPKKLPFFKYSSLFIPRALSFFPCLAAQKTFFSYRNFWNKEFHFLKGKKLAILKKWHFRVNARHFSSFGRTKKLVLLQPGLFWPSGCFRDFFGLQKAFGLLQAKKIPQTALRPKQPGCNKKSFFVLPHDSYVGAFLLKIYQFFGVKKMKYGFSFSRVDIVSQKNGLELAHLNVSALWFRRITNFQP